MASAAGEARASGARLVWIVVLLGLSVVLNYVDRGAMGIASPLMKTELELSAEQYGYAVSAFFWVYAPLCLLMGWLCDRFCVYRMFAAGIALWSLATLLTGWVSGLGMLIVLRLMLGTGEAIAFPGSSKIIAAEVPAAYRGIANAMIGAALAFGPALGTLAGGVILEAAGWRPIFWTFGAVTLLWLVPWHFASAPLRSASIATPVVDPVPLGTLARIPALWAMGAGHFMSNYAFYFLLNWLPLYLTKTLGYSIPEMTLLTTLSFATQGIVALASGHLSDRAVAKGINEAKLRRNAMIVGQLFAVVGITGVWFSRDAVELGTSLVVAGIGSGLLTVNLFAVGQMFSGPRAAGGWIGLQNALGNGSGIIGPIITGIIVDRLGSYGWAFAIAALVAAAGAIWWRWVVPEIRQIAS